MPRLPDKPCATPGCRALVPAGQRRCKLHQSQEDRQYNQEQRPKAHAFYQSKEWREFRQRALAFWGHECIGPGPHNGPLELDHIIPIEQAPDLKLSLQNVRPLCRSCHSRRTARDQMRWGKNSRASQGGEYGTL